MKYFLLCLVWGSVGLSAAFAQSDSTASQLPISPKAYCEYSLDFERTLHYGVYVNPDGNLYTFRYQPKEMMSRKPVTNAKMTEKNLEEEYNHGRKFIRKIEAEEWRSLMILLAEAAKGQMSEARRGNPSSGPQAEHIYRCFVSNEKDNKYQEVILRVRGYANYENLSSSAKELADWLELLRLEAHPEQKSGLPIQTKVSQ
jgi:hypothetical protein